MTTAKPVTPLTLDDVDVLLKRVAGNFEKHGEESVPVLDIAWEAIVSPATMIGLLGAYCERVLFNARGELLEPSEVFQRSDMPVPIAEDLVAQYVKFVLSDNLVREFGEEPDEGEDAAPSQLCPITNLRYEPKTGGGIWLGGTTRIRPTDANEYWAFLEHQGRHAKLTIADSAIKVGNGKQQSLPLTQPGEGFAAARAAAAHQTTDTSGPAQNTSPASDGDADAGGESAPAPGDVPQEPAPAADTPPGYDQGSTLVSRDTGETTQLRSAKEIDDEMVARAQARALEQSKPATESDIGPKTRAELEAAKKRRGSRPIDGRGAH